MPLRRRLRASRPFRFGVVLACAAGALLHESAAQDAVPSDFFDVSADRTSLREVDGEQVLELFDSVTIVHGGVTVTSRRGTHYSSRKLTLLSGDVRIREQTLSMWGEEGEYRQAEDLAVLKKNVHIVDRGWDIRCEEARYSRATGEAWLVGSVVARDSATTIRTSRLLYQRAIARAEAFDDVEITNAEEGFVVTGRHAIYWRDRGEGLVDREPKLVADPDAEEPVTVVSDTMRVYPDSSRALAYYRVKIIKGNTVTQCDSAALYDDRQRVELYGKPLARQVNDSMQGRRMVLHYNDDEVHRIDILGAAMMREAQTDTLVLARDNWVQGDDITLYLHDNRMDSLHVRGSAVSEYYPSSPQKVESNFLKGDRMFFRFRRDEIDYVRVDGAAEGVYRYLDMESGQTADSLRAAADTTLEYVPFRSRAETVVYSAERIEYFADEKDLVLSKTAKLSYRGNDLAGETITYDSELQLLDARGSPVLTEGGQALHGIRMNYDLENQTGLVISGSTKYEQGYYTGENLAKVGDNELKVWNSWYTTCDLKEPHYHFAAREMKVYPDDMIFTGPIWLYVGKTPIFGLPFLANNISRGRQSGFLRPDIEFGATGKSGRFVRNVGYYWATNDYTDFTVIGDFNEDRSFRAHVQNRYRLRYQFTGGVNFSFFRDLSTFVNEWTLDTDHFHTFAERFTANADLRFVSSDRAPGAVNTIDNVQRYIDRSIRSTVSLRKGWNTVGFSASGSRTQNLNVVDPRSVKVDMTLPDVVLSIPSRNLYFGSDPGGAEGFWESLLKNTRYSPSLSARRRVTEKPFDRLEVIAANQGLGLSSPQRIGFLTLSPGVSASNVITRTDFEQRAHQRIGTVGGVPDTTFVPDSTFAGTENLFSWNTGVSASTNFYGTFYPNVGRLRGVRHTMSPSASYRLTPSINGRPRQQSVAMSLRNSLDLKVGGRDTTATGEENVRKLSGVAIWSLGTSYNPEAPSRQAWSNINSNLNLSLAGVNLSLNHTVDPYDFDVLSTSATSRLRLAGSHPFGRSSHVEVRELSAAAAADTAGREKPSLGGVSFEQTGVAADRPAGEVALAEGRLPWSLYLDLSYSKSRGGDARSTLHLGADTKLTDTWQIGYTTIYDVEAKELSGQSFNIRRDLHCWEMSFSRQKLGEEWQYYFRISLKAHPDLYVEDGERGVGSGLMGQF